MIVRDTCCQTAGSMGILLRMTAAAQRRGKGALSKSQKPSESLRQDQAVGLRAPRRRMDERHLDSHAQIRE